MISKSFPNLWKLVIFAINKELQQQNTMRRLFSMRQKLFTATDCDQNLKIKASFRRSGIVLIRCEELPMNKEEGEGVS